MLSYVGRFLRWFGGAPNYSDQLRDNYCEGGSVIVVVHQLSISVFGSPNLHQGGPDRLTRRYYVAMAAKAHAPARALCPGVARGGSVGPELLREWLAITWCAWGNILCGGDPGVRLSPVFFKKN